MSRFLIRVVAMVSAAAVLIGVWRFTAGDSRAAATATSEPKLADDGRLGTLVDSQGLASLRPATSDRWSPLVGRMVLRAGDWLRTDLRGANAVTLRLGKIPTQVILGPGSLVELVTPRQIRVTEGELKITAAPKTAFELIGPDGKKTAVAGTQLYRAGPGGLIAMEKEPAWLRGYEGQTANESLGSLVAKVDGRNVPLTVGYHKVAVDIRDQIARTTIEESFVNHTDGILEGVFYFPLPQDASIAGFGMWINDQLVEADVVEKQRAREIYETILRERRDPGLLEWTGGNIFKARVFPIPAQSEKRITITYTQVLPLRGNTYRYQYALQSEMLRQHPLRQLEIDVKVQSTRQLRSVVSPTHPTRNALTAHAGHVEFSAQEYTPSQDFEVAVELDSRQADVVLVPHRRGDDGYFMLQFTPPAEATAKETAAPQSSAEGQWQRGLLANGQPIELLIVADTSASMDAGSRKAQAEVVAAVLAGLTPRDHINLATCDVDCLWTFAKPVPADAKSIDTARQFLAARRSLGWTNLDKAMASALKQTGRETHVLYLGDGIVSAGDSDPAAFVKRLRRLTEGRPGTFHAIATSSSFEPAVLRAIAATGGGSFAEVGGSRTPQVVALELLGQLTRPALRNVAIEFRGLRTARVYPEQLPNLSPGMQQIVLGRYLPEENQKTAEVIVRGTLDGRPVQFSATAPLAEPGEGNSFIPRLWARAHLDMLLEQGSSAAIRDEIIALSEQYNILTPYTSLLVLESDADRERFKVVRRFQMRDGEKFFAAGRDEANWELVQQQMKRAGSWRIGIRRDVLRQLAAMGRNSQMYSAQLRDTQTLGRMYGMGGGMGGFVPGSVVSGEFSYRGEESTVALDIAGDISHFLGDENGRDKAQRFDESRSLSDESPAGGDRSDLGLEVADMPMASATTASTEPVSGPMAPAEEPALELAAQAKSLSEAEPEAKPAEREYLNEDLKKEAFDGDSLMAVDAEFAPAKTKESMHGWGGRARLSSASISGGVLRLYDAMDYREAFNRRMSGSRPYPWLSTLFPTVPPAPQMPKPYESRWPAEARALAQSLLQNDRLRSLKDGVRIECQSESFDPRWKERTARSRSLALVSPRAWLVRSEGDRSQTTLAWCDGTDRCQVGMAFGLGSMRKAVPNDLRYPPVDTGVSNTSLDLTWPDYLVTLRPEGVGRTRLVLTEPDQKDSEVHLLVDTDRHVLLRSDYLPRGKITSSTIYDNFVQIGGAWWPSRIETVDDKGQRTSLAERTFTALKPDEMAGLWKQELTGQEANQFLRDPLPRLAEAKKRVAGGKALFEDHLVLLLHYQASQQWDKALRHLAQAEKLSGKPGMRWVSMTMLNLARKRETMQQHVNAEAKRLAERAVQSAKAPGGEPAMIGDILFLAEHLRNLSQPVLANNEMLVLEDLLRPVYASQPAYMGEMKNWMVRHADLVEQSGQPVAALRREIAERYPHDAYAQLRYAQALSGTGDYDAAYAWLNRVLKMENRWQGYEEDMLWQAYAEMLRTEGRYDDLTTYLTEWIARRPESSSVYRYYLSALIWADQTKKADTLMAQWIREGQQPGELPPAVDGRLRAAIAQALGQGQNLYTGQIEEQWLRPLGDAALYYARHPSASGVADEIMSSWQFRETEEIQRVRKGALKVLRDDMAKLTPAEIQRLVNWISGGEPTVEPQAWRQIAESLRRRWDAERKQQPRAILGNVLVGVLAGHASPAEQLAFRRTLLNEARKTDRSGYAQQLFQALLAQPWTAEGENEALALLGQISEADELAVRLADQIGALHRLTDAMVQSRFAAAMQKIEHPEKLTRTELRTRREENLRLARTGLADRLEKERRKTEGPLARWMTIERIYFDVRAGRNPKGAADECWELLGPQPGAVVTAGEEPLADIEMALKRRVVQTLLHLAALETKAAEPKKAAKPAQPTLAERLLAWLEKGDAADPDAMPWKGYQYQLLVALDRPADLQKKLRQWIDQDEAANAWRRVLGYLLAEQGRLADAVALFEQVKAADELAAGDYRVLADWYQVLKRRADYDRAIIAAFQAMGENSLSNWIARKLGPWRRSGEASQPTPRELDSQIPLAFVALLNKSSYPQGHLWRLQEFYQATRDFRLLACLADAMIGQTAGHVYPMLQNMGSVFQEVRDEATADSMVERLAEVRKQAKTEIDQRALDLVEALVERRAAELLNQPGPHVERALTAFQRAWKRQWSAGEPRMMGEFLAGLGTIAAEKLAAEQVRELESLYGEAVKGDASAVDRLFLAYHLARAHWTYGRHERAIDLLVAAIDDFRAASGGVLPNHANGPLESLIGYLESRGQFVRGEKFLTEELKRPANVQQSYWLVERLNQLYNTALANNGETALGRGADLYHAVVTKIQKELDTTDQNHRSQLLSRLCSIFRTAKEKRMPGVVDDLRQFAFERLPEVLKRQTNSYDDMVSTTANALHDLAGPRDGLTLLLMRAESEPGWLRYTGQDAWSRYSNTMAQWRQEAAQAKPDQEEKAVAARAAKSDGSRADIAELLHTLNIGELEERLLKITLAALRRDLHMRRGQNRTIYDCRYSYYWREKENDFAKTADAVWAEDRQSGMAATHIAEYLYWGLARHARAIEILADAHRREILLESGQSQLVQFLQSQNRFAESIPVLEPLVARRPENLDYRVWLMRAYFHTGQQPQLLALRKATDEFFHMEGRWNENVMARLGQSCLENQLYALAVEYVQEAIGHRQRTLPGRGIGDGTLSSYYGWLGGAYAGLKKTPEAVDAACGAVVSWGRHVKNRADALATLRAVLAAAPDLDAYVAQLDRQTAESGLENPIVRKALGQVYQEKRDFAKAKVQLGRALDAQPNDAETHQALLACADAQGDKTAAIDELFRWRELARRDLKLYDDLGNRLAKAEQHEEAERAFTSIVEMLPTEAESYQLLAEIRQRQNRWGEAIPLWRQVAQLRALEPTGLVGLATAEIHERDWNAAANTLAELRKTVWPMRFTDVTNQINTLQQQVDAGRK